MLDWSETHTTALFQSDMLLMVTILTFIPVNSRQWAAEIHLARIVPHGDRSGLSDELCLKANGHS